MLIVISVWQDVWQDTQLLASRNINNWRWTKRRKGKEVFSLSPYKHGFGGPVGVLMLISVSQRIEFSGFKINRHLKEDKDFISAKKCIETIQG